MRQLFLLSVICCCALCAPAQEFIKNYVQQHTAEINSIDPNATSDADLAIIANAIGNARIVMLGEQDHGDAPTFLAKTRLIKYLHEHLGFNVLAFESDFFGLNFGWETLTKTPQSVDTFIHKNVFPIWTGCNTCQPLFNNYIPNTYTTNNPLIVTGFDNQMILNYSSNHLVAKLDSVLRAANFPITKQDNYTTEILPLLEAMPRWYYAPPKDTKLYKDCTQYLADIQQQAATRLESNSFWQMVINNLVQENLSFTASQNGYKLARNTRDAQMALNLKWLAQHKYANEKIIVWAANYHIAKYTDTASGIPAKSLTTMGSFFTRDTAMLNSTYIIVFTSYSGTAGRLGYKNYTIQQPRHNGFETWVNNQFNYAFVNLSTYRNTYSAENEKFFLKGLGHNSFKNTWANIFDGIFYIKNMYPCKK